MRLKTGAIVVVCVLVVGGAGGGFWAYRRYSDPLHRAEQMETQGNLRGAVVELRTAQRDDPRNADIHLRIAKIDMKLADPVAAEREFRLAAGLGMDPWTVMPLLGEAMIAQGEYREILRQILPRGPTPEIAAKNLLLRSVAQFALKDIPGAAATLALAEKAAPGRPETMLIAARLAASKGDLAETETRIAEVLKADPMQIEALLMKEQILVSKGDQAGALAVADLSIQSAPWSAMAHMQRANLLMAANQDAKAQLDVNAVLAVAPRFDEAVYLNGVIMARAGKYADALLQLSKMEGAVDRFPQALFWEATAASQLGQAEQAADYARRYYTLVPNDPAGRRLLGQTELIAKRPDAAIKVLKEAVAAGQTDAETLDTLGRAYVAVGNSPAALDSFDKAAAVAPKDAAILSHLGFSQMQVGNAQAAVDTLEHSLELGSATPTTTESLIVAALDAGDIDKAETALKRLRSEVGETESVGVLTGMVRAHRGDLEGARVALTATLKAFPDSLRTKLNLARVLVGLGRRPAAITILAEMIAKQPANFLLLNEYLPLVLQENQPADAITALERARKAQPDQLAFTAMLADTLVMTKAPDQALKMLQDATVNGELAPVLMAPLARAELATGHGDEAERTYKAILKANPKDLISRSALVDLYLASKRPADAKAQLQEALQIGPDNFRTMTALVMTEAAANGLDSALKVAEDIRKDPAHMPAAAFLKGDQLMRANRPLDGALAYQVEFRADPSAAMLLRMTNAFATAGQDDMAADNLRFWLKDHTDPPEAAAMLAQLDIRAKRYEDAKTHLAMVLDKRPNDPQALNNLAWVYAETNDSRARATAQKAYLAAPTPDAADTLGWIMAKDDPKAAIPILKQASSERPANATIQYHLAVALKNDGQPAEASKILQPIVSGTQVYDDKPAATQLLHDIAH